MKKRILAKKDIDSKENLETPSKVDWRTILLNEAEWRIHLLAMLERIAIAQERRNLMLNSDGN